MARQGDLQAGLTAPEVEADLQALRSEFGCPEAFPSTPLLSLRLFLGAAAPLRLGSLTSRLGAAELELSSATEERAACVAEVCV